MPTWHAWVEIAALAALVTAARLIFGLGLPWMALAPLLAGVRYGSCFGVACAVAQVAMVSAAAHWYGALDAPTGQPILGWLFAGLIPGQFCDAWRRRLHQLAARACDATQRLGALLRHRNDRPLVITEHGIYTKERKIDLASAEYIAGDHDPRATEFGQRLWMRFFEGLGRIAYASANHIIALYEGSRRRQIQDGADPVRTRVIPNGVDIRRFAAIRATRPCAPAPVLGLLGRVVPIKDVKCFIRAMKSVIARPEARGCIIGPTSEDPGYARELPPAPSYRSPIRTRWHMRPSRSSAIPRAGARPSRPHPARRDPLHGSPRVRRISTDLPGGTHGRRRSSAQL